VKVHGLVVREVAGTNPAIEDSISDLEEVLLVAFLSSSGFRSTSFNFPGTVTGAGAGRSTVAGVGAFAG